MLHSINIDQDQKEKILDWLEGLNLLGPFAAIPVLARKIGEAPEMAWTTAEYSYVVGLMVGRLAGGTVEYSDSTVQDMRAAAEHDSMKLGMCDGLAIAYGWI